MPFKALNLSESVLRGVQAAGYTDPTPIQLRAIPVVLGGGDTAMLNEIFLPHADADPYLRASDERGGTAAVLVGVAANQCMATGQPVQIADLLTDFGRPDFAAMPSRSGPLPMPQPAAIRSEK